MYRTAMQQELLLSPNVASVPAQMGTLPRSSSMYRTQLQQELQEVVASQNAALATQAPVTMLPRSSSMYRTQAQQGTAMYRQRTPLRTAPSSARVSVPGSMRMVQESYLAAQDQDGRAAQAREAALAADAKVSAAMQTLAATTQHFPQVAMPQSASLQVPMPGRAPQNFYLRQAHSPRQSQYS
jgi:hypothetical protein